VDLSVLSHYAEYVVVVWKSKIWLTDLFSIRLH